MQFIKDVIMGFLTGTKGTNSWILIVLVVILVVIVLIVDRIKKIIMKKNDTQTINKVEDNNGSCEKKKK